MKYFVLGLFLGLVGLFILNSDFTDLVMETVAVSTTSSNTNQDKKIDFTFKDTVDSYEYNENEFIKRNFLTKDELYTKSSEPYTIEDFEKFLVTLAYFGLESEEVFYPMTFDTFESSQILNNFNKAQTITLAKYPELFAQFKVYDATYKSNNVSKEETYLILSIRGEENITPAENIYKHSSVVNKSYELLKNMEQTNLIDKSMSQEELAKIVYTHISLNSAYDETLKKQTAYDLLFKGTSVCQGYTSVYNMMLKMLGIDVVGVTGTAQGIPHIWSYVNMDNQWVYSDATFGDPIPDNKNEASYKFFKLSRNEISKTHVFDE